MTGQFCKKLVNDVIINFDSIKDNSIHNIIKDYYWFFKDFEYDASISSMLVMLQAIHKKASDIGLEECKKYWDILTSENCSITLLFLDIHDIGLTDEIYIKMNARGKPLTEFENFKAQLTIYLERKGEKSFSEQILRKINCRWAQFFWSIQYKNDNKKINNSKRKN